MHKAIASERNDLGLRIAPAGERVGPFPRTTDIENRLTQGDHLAVGDSRERRRDLVCGDRHHDLVEQRRAVGHPPLEDQRVPAAQPREQRRVGIRKALGDLPGFDKTRIGARVSAEQAWQRGEHPQPGLLDAVAAALVHEPSAAGDPAHRRSQIAAEEEAERMPKRTASGAFGFASRQPRAMGADPCLFAGLISSEHVRGNRKALEILAVQLPLAMRHGQISERVPHIRRANALRARSSRSAGHQPHDTSSSFGAATTAPTAGSCARRISRSENWTAFTPWPEALRGDVDLATGDTATALERYEHAFALASQLGDPCFDSAWRDEGARCRFSL
jgi:hypothetical protein